MLIDATCCCVCIADGQDLGRAFLKAYATLQPDYICLLHPLAYLTKASNTK